MEHVGHVLRQLMLPCIVPWCLRGPILEAYMEIWAPPHIKSFVWLALQDRCWTTKHLARHCLPHKYVCALCDQEEKTMQHLLARCSFSRQVRHAVLAWVQSTTNLPNEDMEFHAWWATSCAHASTATRKGLASHIILTAWWL